MFSIRKILYFLSIPLIVILIMAFKDFADDKKLETIKNRNTDQGFAVVELFTSEGCSSCPPADELIAELEQDKSNKQLYIMAFHVDYWNHQGWRDRFSNSKFTARQKQYAKWLQLPLLYTPQLIINGKMEMVGSATSKVISGINSVIQETHLEQLKLKAESIKDETIQVGYTSTSTVKNTAILVALVQKQASSAVSAGENAGKALSHVQVVRDLQSRRLKKQDSFTFKLPVPNMQWEIIAFEQDLASGEIIDITSIDL